MTHPQHATDLSSPSTLASGEAAQPLEASPQVLPHGVLIPEVRPGEDVFGYLQRVHGGFELTRYQQLIGAANPYKEGDEAIGVAAADERSRANARALF